MQAAYLVWRNLSYEVSVTEQGHKTTKQLLVDVSGHVRTGTLLALMGASGAGKTTLLDVLARRKTAGTITGTVTLFVALLVWLVKRFTVLVSFAEMGNISTTTLSKSQVQKTLIDRASLCLTLGHYCVSAGYVEQFHALPSKATVREAVAFAANIRLPTCLSMTEREAAVDRALRLLQLDRVADMIIGEPTLREYVVLACRHLLDSLNSLGD